MVMTALLHGYYYPHTMIKVPPKFALYFVFHCGGRYTFDHVYESY